MIKNILKDLIGNIFISGLSYYLPIFIGRARYKNYRAYLKEKFKTDIPHKYKMRNGLVAAILFGILIGLLSFISVPIVFLSMILGFINVIYITRSPEIDYPED